MPRAECQSVDVLTPVTRCTLYLRWFICSASPPLICLDVFGCCCCVLFDSLSLEDRHGNNRKSKRATKSTPKQHRDLALWFAFDVLMIFRKFWLCHDEIILTHKSNGCFSRSDPLSSPGVNCWRVDVAIVSPEIILLAPVLFGHRHRYIDADANNEPRLPF